MTGCQSDEIVAEKPTQEDGKRTVTFSMNIPDFQVKSRAESETPITKIDLMLFDADRRYIETIQASSITVDIKEVGKDPKGQFTATIDPATTTIHFIANYNGILTATPGQTEDEVIPNLTADADNIVYWARETGITAETTAIEITFLRHLAKVTVEVSKEVVAGSTQAANTYFQVTDFMLCNYVSKGTIAPKNYQWGHTGNPDTETVTEVNDVKTYITSTSEKEENDPTPKELYLAEYNNQGNLGEQVYVIIAGKLKPQNSDGTWNTEGEWGKTKYYKVMLSDAKDNPFKIIRNVNYHIIIKQMQDVGANRFVDAKNAGSINNLYASVMQESPSISDMEGNSLEVTPLVHLLTTGKNIESTIKTTAVTDEFKSGDIKLEWSRTGDDGDWLKDISISNGKLTATVSTVTEMKQAEIRVKWGKLSRTVTVIASPQYTITAQAYDDDAYNNVKSSYSGVDEDVYFRFHLDEDYPAAADYPDLYPIKCYIRADNLYPVDNKDMLIDYEYKEGQYWYTYLAPATGFHAIHFKTKLSTVNEKIEVESPYFSHAEVPLTYQELKRFTNLSLNNGNTIYRGAGTVVPLKFTTESATTITISTTGLTLKEGVTGITKVKEGEFTYTTLGATTVNLDNHFVLAANNTSKVSVTLSAENYQKTEISAQTVKRNYTLTMSGAEYYGADKSVNVSVSMEYAMNSAINATLTGLNGTGAIAAGSTSATFDLKTAAFTGERKVVIPGNDVYEEAFESVTPTKLLIPANSINTNQTETRSVTISYNGKTLKSNVSFNSKNTTEISIEQTGLTENSTLTFTYSSGGFLGWGATTYTASTTAGSLVNGTATLNFTEQ